MYRESLEQITYLQVKVIGGASVYVRHIPPTPCKACTQGHDRHQVLARVRDVQQRRLCLAAFADMYVSLARGSCMRVYTAKHIHKIVCDLAVTSFRRVSMIDDQSGFAAFIAKYLREHLMGNLAGCRS